MISRAFCVVTKATINCICLSHFKPTIHFLFILILFSTFLFVSDQTGTPRCYTPEQFASILTKEQHNHHLQNPFSGKGFFPFPLFPLFLPVFVIRSNRKMVKEDRGVLKSRSFHFRKMFEINPTRLFQESESGRFEEPHEEKLQIWSHSQGATSEGSAFEVTTPEKEFPPPLPLPVPRSNSEPAVASGFGSSIPIPVASGSSRKDRPMSELDMMKERFAKLLLGEDMSGGGKGVSSALALSNAITNLAASVFGEQSKLEPMASDRKARWKREIDWLLSVTDYIVELVPSQQKAKDGTCMEIMVTQQRKDLLLNIPALRKLDTMLLGTLDNFGIQQEFWYVSKDAQESEKGIQRNGKWWKPTVKVPPSGLSEESRYFLQKQKEAVNQVLKASMAINAQTLSDMEIPDSYIESLPKNGRSSLGDLIYKSITIEFFDPLQFLSTMDMATEHKVLDLKNRIEASIVIWKRKMHHKDGKSAWGSAVSLEKRELFEERAETILLLLKQQFPGLPQSSLEISKIQYNKNVGLSILESYSRVLESLANTVMSCLEDVLYADSLAQDPTLASMDASPSPVLSCSPPGEESEKLSSSSETPSSMTLSDFMGWNIEQPQEPEIRKRNSMGNLDLFAMEEEGEKVMTKPMNVNIRKLAFIDKLENGARSPTPRQ